MKKKGGDGIFNKEGGGTPYGDGKKKVGVMVVVVIWVGVVVRGGDTCSGIANKENDESVKVSKPGD